MEKKKWVDFEITKVKLNPEQAVLSCCESVSKPAVGGGGENYQCDNAYCQTSESVVNTSS